MNPSGTVSAAAPVRLPVPSLQPFTAALLECVTPAEVVAAVVDRGRHVLAARAGVVALISPDGLTLDVVTAGAPGPGALAKRERFPVDGPFPLADVVRAATPLYLESRAVWTARYPHLADDIESGAQAFASLPLVARQRVFGAVQFSFAEAREFTEADRALLDELGRQSALALDRALALEEERARALREQGRLVRELQEASARQVSSLDASEERFRLLVESVRDYAIFMLDTDGSIASWNAGAERFKGYTAAEIIGQHFSRFYTPEDIARRHPWNELEAATREGRYEEEGWRVRKDGSRFWASVVITALRDESGHLRGFGKVTRDFTERRERENERTAAAAIEQQRRFLKDVLASVTQGKLMLCDGETELPAPLDCAEGDGGPVRLTAQSLRELRARVGAATAACALPDDRAQDFLTAVSECAMNAVVHAGGGRAQVGYSRDAEVVQVRVDDRGKGIDLASLPRATLERGFSTGGSGFGHGFWLMLQTCDRVYLLTGSQGTTVVLEQDKHPPSPAWM